MADQQASSAAKNKNRRKREAAKKKKLEAQNAENKEVGVIQIELLSSRQMTAVKFKQTLVVTDWAIIGQHMLSHRKPWKKSDFHLSQRV